MHGYAIERLSNNLIRVTHRQSGLVSLFNPDGTRHSGQVKMTRTLAVELLPYLT
jgi:hypothetical protein